MGKSALETFPPCRTKQLLVSRMALTGTYGRGFFTPTAIGAICPAHGILSSG